MVEKLVSNLATIEASGDIEAQIKIFSMRTVLWAAVILVVLLLLAAKFMKRLPKIKLPLFSLIVGAVLIPTVILFSSTIYLNTNSDSGGPVHWHTDLEVWVCDQELELRDPSSAFSNKIGSSTFHEHNDKRLHLEGVVVNKNYDASLEKFMLLVGGKISKTELSVPVEESLFVSKTDGDSATGDEADVRALLTRDEKNKAVISASNDRGCGNTPAEVQAFVYTFDESNNTYSQAKLDDPARYVMRDEPNVPPGDCLIIEFGAVKDRTNKLCLQYGVRDENRCTQFGVTGKDRKRCDIHEVSANTGGVE